MLVASLLGTFKDAIPVSQDFPILILD